MNYKTLILLKFYDWLNPGDILPMHIVGTHIPMETMSRRAITTSTSSTYTRASYGISACAVHFVSRSPSRSCTFLSSKKTIFIFF